MQANDTFEIVTSQLLEMVELAIELQDFDTPDAFEYWNGFKDAICMLLGDLAGKRPVIVDDKKYMMFMNLRLENEVDNIFDDDGNK